MGRQQFVIQEDFELVAADANFGGVLAAVLQRLIRDAGWIRGDRLAFDLLNAGQVLPPRIDFIRRLLASRDEEQPHRVPTGSPRE